MMSTKLVHCIIWLVCGYIMAGTRWHEQEYYYVKYKAVLDFPMLWSLFCFVSGPFGLSCTLIEIITLYVVNDFEGVGWRWRPYTKKDQYMKQVADILGDMK